MVDRLDSCLSSMIEGIFRPGVLALGDPGAQDCGELLEREFRRVMIDLRGWLSPPLDGKRPLDGPTPSRRGLPARGPLRWAR
jgi:hypothetical protein